MSHVSAGDLGAHVPQRADVSAGRVRQGAVRELQHHDQVQGDAEGDHTQRLHRQQLPQHVHPIHPRSANTPSQNKIIPRIFQLFQIFFLVFMFFHDFAIEARLTDTRDY